MGTCTAPWPMCDRAGSARRHHRRPFLVAAERHQRADPGRNLDPFWSTFFLYLLHAPHTFPPPHFSQYLLTRCHRVCSAHCIEGSRTSKSSSPDSNHFQSIAPPEYALTQTPFLKHGALVRADSRPSRLASSRPLQLGTLGPLRRGALH